jgi:hypothetical protein
MLTSRSSTPGARIVEVIWKVGKQEDGWYTNAPIIVNLSVCKESRNEALKTHKPRFPCNGSLARIPFNFATDTLLLGRKMEGTEKTFKKERYGNTDLEKVQFLMVDASVNWGRRTSDDRGKGNLGHLSHLIFKSVKEHAVLYTGHTDPFPHHWAEMSWFPKLPKSRSQGGNPYQQILRIKQEWPNVSSKSFETLGRGYGLD